MEKIAKFILKQFASEGIEVKDPDKVVAKVTGLISENIEMEKQIEADAEKLLKQHKAAIGGQIDESKALRMIKDKIASERKFVL